jgi:hypothetical protein
MAGFKVITEAMRPVAIGRRNWLHLGSKEAGPKIAAIFSIVESCRWLNIPIRRYLAEILSGMANRSVQSFAELTPGRLRCQPGKVTCQTCRGHVNPVLGRRHTCGSRNAHVSVSPG